MVNAVVYTQKARIIIPRIPWRKRLSDYNTTAEYTAQCHKSIGDISDDRKNYSAGGHKDGEPRLLQDDVEKKKRTDAKSFMVADPMGL